MQRNTKFFGRPEVDVDLTVARGQHDALITKLMTGSSDTEGAMYRAERMYGLAFWAQHRLRYRKAATASFIERVRQAYLSTLHQSVRRDLEKLKTLETIRSVDADVQNLIDEAQNLLARMADATGNQKG
jgi:hypothetical protein